MRLILLLLVLGGLGSYRAGKELWAGYHLRAANRAIQRHDLTLAQAHLALCLEVRSDSAKIHFLTARTARRAGDEAEAEAHLKECSRLAWPQEALDLERALHRAQRGDLDAVEGALLAAVRRGGEDEAFVLEALAQGYLRTYRLAEALHCLDRLLGREPDHVPALVWRGEVKERRNDLPEAIRSYRRAVELAPENDEARLRLAECLTRYERTDEAVGHFERLLDSQPANPRLLLGLARCRRSAGRGVEARELLGTLLDFNPGHAEALAERGKLALEAGDAAEAERWLRRALAQAPFDRDINYNLVQCLLNQGKAEEARTQQARLDRISADFQRAAEVTRMVAGSPKDPALRYEAGVILLRNGQEQEGVRWLLTALQVDPGHRPTHAALADFYERRGQPLEAARHRGAAGPTPPAPKEGQRP
jgi:predicted Zn-dependent protease